MRTDKALLYPLPGKSPAQQATHLGQKFVAILKMEWKADIMDDSLSTCVKCGLLHYSAEFVMPVNVGDMTEHVPGCPRCQADPEYIAALTTRYARYLGRRETYLRYKSEGIALRFPVPLLEKEVYA